MKEGGKDIPKLIIVYLKLRILVMLLPEYTSIKYPRKPGKEILEICFGVINVLLIILRKSRRSHHSGLNFRDIS